MVKYPKTKIKNIKEIIHGVEVNDPYRWLENNNSLLVKKWSRRQNQLTRSVLNKISFGNQLKKEFKKLLSYDSIGSFSVRENKYFFLRHHNLQNQPILYVKEKNSKERILINPNKLSKTGRISLDWWHLSKDGLFIAYGLSKNGDENSILYVKNVLTGKNLLEKIPYTNACDVAWLPDNSGFYYTRMPIPGTVLSGDENYYQRVYFHKIGTNYKDDQVVFGEEREKEDLFGLELSKDGNFLLVTAYKRGSVCDVYLFNRNQNKWNIVVENVKAFFSPTFHRDSIYILTNYKSPNFKICLVLIKNIDRGIKFWKTIIKENKYPIEEFQVISDYLFVLNLKNVISNLRVFNLNGKFLSDVKISIKNFDLVSISNLVAMEEGDELFFISQSFFNPPAVYRVKIPELKVDVWEKVICLFDLSFYKAKQVWYKSKDGVNVPMFILYKDKFFLNGKNSVLLTAYGGFSVNLTPYFDTTVIPFLDDGGIYAIANIRGGGEFGEKWHKYGMLDKKQKSFDDFIVAAEWLVKNKYTNIGKLAIQGGSNGGLLVAAVSVQRPELFRAAVAVNPLFDMIRYEKTLIGRLWNKEYGSIDNKKDFFYLLKYSPYHNMKKAGYPAIFVSVGEKDARVDPFHAKKMCASFQQATFSDLPVLLRIDKKSGHGGGKPLNQWIEEYADIWSFVFWQLRIVN